MQQPTSASLRRLHCASPGYVVTTLAHCFCLAEYTQVSWELLQRANCFVATARDVGVFVGIQQMEYASQSAPFLHSYGPFLGMEIQTCWCLAACIRARCLLMMRLLNWLTGLMHASRSAWQLYGWRGGLLRLLQAAVCSR